MTTMWAGWMLAGCILAAAGIVAVWLLVVAVVVTRVEDRRHPPEAPDGSRQAATEHRDTDSDRPHAPVP